MSVLQIYNNVLTVLVLFCQQTVEQSKDTKSNSREGGPRMFQSKEISDKIIGQTYRFDSKPNSNIIKKKKKRRANAMDEQTSCKATVLDSTRPDTLQVACEWAEAVIKYIYQTFELEQQIRSYS